MMIFSFISFVSLFLFHIQCSHFIYFMFSNFSIFFFFNVLSQAFESWIIKRAEHKRIDAFELWCWEDSWESLGLQGDPTSPS